MRDGRTRKLEAESPDPSFSEYSGHWQASIVIARGDAAGMDFALEKQLTTLGRGPGVDLCFDDSAMSREHAAIEFVGEGFRIRDLGSRNGVRLEDSVVGVGDLKHGDRFQLGEHLFRFLLEKRQREPRTYVLPDE